MNPKINIILDLPYRLSDRIRTLLPTKPGLENSLVVSPIPPRLVNDLITFLSGKNFYIDDFNGCDMDWSSIDDVNIDGREYHIWGCGMSGSLCFQLAK